MFDCVTLNIYEKERRGERDRAIREIVDIEIRCVQISLLSIHRISPLETREHISEAAHWINRA